MAATTSNRVPTFVPKLNVLLKRLLRIGIPLGPNGLLTVQGRKSGVMRTTPVAVVEVGGQRWIVGTFGDVNWVRNLRAAGKATVRVGRHRLDVTAKELTREEAAAFFRDVILPYVGGSVIKRFLLGMLGAREIL